MLRSARGYLLFATTIFLSAFLLFLIQPIAGKLLLPWFGGSSSVWATSMLFFTGMLFFGYCYAYYLTRFPIKKQIRIHTMLAGLGALAALISLIIWRGLFPSLDWTTATAIPPALKTLFSLVLGVGVPYFLLSTTGPLVQHWYGLTSEKEPYKLYAISNIGSLLALASYPFLIEPNTFLEEQEMVWTIMFLIFTALLVYIARSLPHVAHSPSKADHTPYATRLLWIFYAALPAFMLVATTTEITQTIAPLPLLWLAPLSVYLLTFIIAFAGFRSRYIVPVLLFASAYGAWTVIDPFQSSMKMRVGFDIAVLFFLGLHAHAHLYRLRPARGDSAFFYVFVSLGGMIGTLLASVVPPLVFPDYYEFAIGIAVAAAVALHISPAPWPFGKHTTPRYVLKVVCIAFVLTLIAFGLYDYFKDRNDVYRHVSRNFYGAVKVYSDDTYRSLLHGSTMHGMQLLDPKYEFVPYAYYAPESGLGRAFMHERAVRPDHALRVGILGLGAGMTASYCVPGDAFVYYEIDPRIEDIARSEFTYLTKCPQADIRLGDGRILMDQEFRANNQGSYDLIAVDAFNDDTIPVHLITRDAIQRYVSHLRDEKGIVAVHISNRYLDLLPVVMSIAQEEGLALLDVRAGIHDNTSATHWVLLSPSSETFNAEIFRNVTSMLSEKKVPAWTDSYSNILSIIEM